MRAFHIMALAIMGMAGWMVMRVAEIGITNADAFWWCGVVMVVLSTAGVIANVWTGDAPNPEPIGPEPTPVSDGRMRWTDLPPKPKLKHPVYGHSIRRRCGHVEPWEKMCADCTVLLLLTECHDCAVETDQPITIVGCQNCPPVPGVRA